MNEPIEAGSGKIKKKRKPVAVNAIARGNGIITPHFEGWMVSDGFKKITKSVKIFNDAEISDLDYFDDLYNKNQLLFNIRELGKRLSGSRYFLDNRHDIRFSKKPGLCWNYFFDKVPDYPEIKMGVMHLPKVDREFLKSALEANPQTSLYFDTRNHEINPYYWKVPELAAIWQPITEKGQLAFNLQLFFDYEKKAKTSKGIYVPLLKGDSRIPDQNTENKWHIFTVDYDLKEYNHKFQYHDTMRTDYTHECSRKADGKCNYQEHFWHSLEDAIKKYGTK